MARPNAAQRHRVQRGLLTADQWGRELEAWGAQCETDFALIRDGVVQELFTSITVGSSLTGAPGQPVDKGDLLRSWTIKREPGKTVISSDSPYARAIEHAWRKVSGAGRSILKQTLESAAAAAGLVQKTREWRSATRLTKARVREYRRSFGGLNFRNGGAHSVRLSWQGHPRIVAFVTRAVTGGA